MIGLLQRVTHAEVHIAGESVAAIGEGLLVLVGVERGDDAATAGRLLERLLGYRVFADAAGRMNRSLADTGGGLLLVPQFTLLADTRKGSRPGFSGGADAAEAQSRFAELEAAARSRHSPVAAGVFGADMQVSLCNDGPVTFWLQVPPREP
ncbi:D-aminoacyl-tRNA deacylase [Spiribacter pallidus]|jgi:D-tyrosyl-tRNA(Tyr) deacylase|uniref:D-aminoacyl-tRNA deacylase n=1 Tax=Spiribacter pallidus TaxID=1987936 RepID=A0ABV3TFM6_9GAMM